MQIVCEPGDEVPATAAWRGTGVLCIISPASTTGRHEEIAGSCSDARRGNFHPTAVHLMSCEAHFTHTACLCLAQHAGMGPAPAQPQPHMRAPYGAPATPMGTRRSPLHPLNPSGQRAAGFGLPCSAGEPSGDGAGGRGMLRSCSMSPSARRSSTTQPGTARGCSGAGLFP